MVAAGATLWGLWPLFLRQAGLSGPQNALLALLTMALPTPFLMRRESWKDRRATLALVIMGVAAAINMALFFAAVKRGPVAIAMLTHYLAPLLVALTAPWVTGERHCSCGSRVYLEPLTATLTGWVFLGEALGTWGLLGGVLVLAVRDWVATDPRASDSLLPSISGSS